MSQHSTAPKSPRILIIDNYDSFTYNLVHYVGELGAQTRVVRNDALNVQEAMAMRPDPSGQVFIDLNAVDLKMAEHHIDLLDVLEEKCKGNLTDEESKMLTETLHGLRSQFVQVQMQVQEHIAKQGGGLTSEPPAAPNPSDQSSSDGGSGLIIP